MYTADYLKLNPALNYGPDTNSMLILQSFRSIQSSRLLDAEVNIILWSGIEACASTICANLPIYSPLITKSRTMESIVTSFRSKFFPGSNNSSYRAGKHSKGVQLSSSSENIVKQGPGVETIIEGGRHQSIPENELEMGTINVRTTFDA